MAQQEPSSPGGRTPGTAQMTDDELVSGFSRAVRSAIDDLHRRGIPTTHVIDGELVRVHPDGRREVLGKVQTW